MNYYEHHIGDYAEATLHFRQLDLHLLAGTVSDD